MSKFTGPTWKVSRRLNYSISETGKELQKRPYAPGQHGQKRQKLKEYGLQLHEKQKVRFTYGVNEKQFKKTFVEASKLSGKTGENFIKLLESRLDNLVYRVKPGQVIGIKESSRNLGIIKANLEAKISRVQFIEFDAEKLETKYVRLAERNEVLPEIKEQLIVEFYNR